jgi:hypothetical protein
MTVNIERRPPSIFTETPCEVCPDWMVTFAAREWVVCEPGDWAGAGHCIGHEFAACPMCADYIRRKGCPSCFW